MWGDAQWSGSSYAPCDTSKAGRWAGSTLLTTDVPLGKCRAEQAHPVPHNPQADAWSRQARGTHCCCSGVTLEWQSPRPSGSLLLVAHAVTVTSCHFPPCGGPPGVSTTIRLFVFPPMNIWVDCSLGLASIKLLLPFVGGVFIFLGES